jgi:hypothetical protein
MLNPIELIEIVQATEAKERFGYVTFPALTASGPCDACLENEQYIYTEDEILGNFEYAEKASANVWLPKVHPNCVCKMFRYEEEDTDKLSDHKFELWLLALLTAGTITKAEYDIVVARRKKKQEQTQT